MSQTVEKACTLCGTNLNGQKRVKNPAGEYYCPPCWKTQSTILGDPTDLTIQSAPVAVAPPPSARTQSASPTVRVVRSELEPTIAQAAVAGLKGTVNAAIRLLCKAVIIVQLIAVLGLVKKFYPDTNNGIMIVLTRSAVIAGVFEVDLVAKSAGYNPLFIDAGFFTSRVGIIVMIGLGIGYAMAIALAVTGG